MGLREGGKMKDKEQITADIGELIEIAIEMLAYVPEYFDKKWKITERFKEIRKKLE